MRLKDLRQQFVEVSGRYDLLEETDEGRSTAKADFFINAGSRMLDQKVTAKHVQMGVITIFVPPDMQTVQLPNCWQVHEVWGMPPDGSGVRRRLHEVRENSYFHGFFHHAHRHAFPSYKPHHGFYHGMGYPYGIPGHYAVLTTRNEKQLEDLRALSANVPANYMETGEWNSSIISLELYPKFHGQFDIEVKGKFFSPYLTHDDDTNIWSQAYPMLLVKAACYALETVYRNTEGARDWLNSIQMDLTDIEQMDVETDVRRFSVMEG